MASAPAEDGVDAEKDSMSQRLRSDVQRHSSAAQAASRTVPNASEIAWVRAVQGHVEGALSAAFNAAAKARAKDPVEFIAEVLRQGGASLPQGGVTVVTDIEGNWEYFLTWVQKSRAVTLTGLSGDGSANIELLDGWQVVFGGDSSDKGGIVGGTVRVVKSLVRLKERYPDRVTLLIGNRDANKMRITSEFAMSQLDSTRLPKIPGPYFVPEAKRVSPGQYLRRCLEKQGNANPSAAELAAANTPFRRLLWMLDETMGAAGEAERRRAELGLLSGGAPVSDDAVVASFVESVQSGGFMRRFLELAEMAKIIDSTLYVHGGIISMDYGGGADECVGFVPGLADRVQDVHEWVRLLNRWSADQVTDWIARPTWDDPDSVEGSGRGGHWLMDYARPGCPPSVIYGRHLDKGGMPRHVPTDVMAKLNRGGVRRIVVGHTPHGNCPTVIKSRSTCGNHVLEVIMCDTSYSDMSQADNRGTAISTVDVHRDDTVRVAGVLHDDTPIEYTLQPGIGPEDEYIGHLEPPEAVAEDSSQRFSKARVKGSNDLLMCHVAGFRTTYSRIKERDMAEAQVLAVLHKTRSPDAKAAAAKAKAASSAEPPPLHTFTSSGDECCMGTGHNMTHLRREALAMLFDVADTDRDGNLGVHELRSALTKDRALLKVIADSGRQVPEVGQLLAAMDSNGNGSISLNEFVDWFEKS